MSAVHLRKYFTIHILLMFSYMHCILCILAVKFIWDCTVESLERLKKEDGSGCILAHCMGLGKTLSVNHMLQACNGFMNRLGTFLIYITASQHKYKLYGTVTKYNNII